MSKPHPLIAIRMFQKVLSDIRTENIKFFVGDIVKISDKFEKSSFIATIKYPYCYPIQDEQSYCVENYVIPWKESEIKLIQANKNGREDTVKLFEDCIAKAEMELKNDTWVSN